jgi:hypothetical protein
LSLVGGESARKQKEELKKYKFIVSTIPWPGARIIGEGTGFEFVSDIPFALTLAGSQLAAARASQFVSFLRKGRIATLMAVML